MLVLLRREAVQDGMGTGFLHREAVQDIMNAGFSPSRSGDGASNRSDAGYTGTAKRPSFDGGAPLAGRCDPPKVAPGKIVHQLIWDLALTVLFARIPLTKCGLQVPFQQGLETVMGIKLVDVVDSGEIEGHVKPPFA